MILEYIKARNPRLMTPRIATYHGYLLHPSVTLRTGALALACVLSAMSILLLDPPTEEDETRGQGSASLQVLPSRSGVALAGGF